MPRVRALKSNFTAGELSPRLEDRHQLAKQQNGLRSVLNWAITPHGTIYCRSGTRHIALPSFESPSYRLVPFTFSVTDAYQLLFGNLMFEIYRSGGRIESGGSPVTVATPWSSDDLSEIVWSQSGDDVYVTHDTKMPKIISRSSHVDWAVSDWDFDRHDTTDRIYQPHFKFVDKGITLNPSATSGTITLVASDDVFEADHVGTRFRIVNKEIEITIVTDAQNATAAVKETLTSSAETDDWTEQAFSDVRGWPRTVGFHQGRLVIGGSRDIPNRVWLSKTRNWLNFDLGTSLDDEAIELDLGGGIAVDGITWLASFRGTLFVGTLSRPWTITSGLTTDATLTPKQSQANSINGPGAPLQAAIEMNGAVTYIDNTRRRLIGLRYSVDADGFQPEDLSLLAEHITSPSLDYFVFQRDKENIGWGVRGDGTLLGFTYQPEHDVGGWHRHEIGGGGLVESVSIMTTATRDELWMVVHRDGVYSVERMDPKFDTGSLQKDAFFVDAGLSYSGGPVSSVSGLDHLEGKTVEVVGDGGVVGEYMVTDGAVTLDDEYSTIHAGLHYDKVFEPLGSDVGGTEGSIQGVKRRVIEFEMDVIRTHRLNYGETDDNMYPLVFAEYPITLDAAPTLTTGARRQRFQTGWRNETVFRVSNPDPMPAEVRSLTLRISTNG